MDRPPVVHHIEHIVERVSGALGPDANPADVEAAASSLIEATGMAELFIGGCLHISLTDCSSLLTNTVRSRAYDKIRRIGSHAASALRESSIGGHLHIVTTSMTAVAARASATDLIILARMLDDAARDCSASEITGLAASSDGTVDRVTGALISVIPEVLEATGRIAIDIRPTRRDGAVNIDAVAHFVASARRVGGPQENALRLRLLTNANVPIPSTDATFYVRADVSSLIDAAFSAAPGANLHEIGGILTATAFELGRRVARQGELASTIVANRSGLDVRFGGIEVDAGTGSSHDLAVRLALGSAITQGFRAAARSAHHHPQRVVAAFTNASSDAGAGARLVNDLARCSGSAVAVHAVFAERRAGERIRIGPFPDVLVEEPPDRFWFGRGGWMPSDGRPPDYFAGI